MAITSRDDLLFCWDQRVKPGVLPIIGGDPVFDRDSARTFIGADRKLRSAIVDTPVLEYEEVNGVLRPVLPMALARTNKLGYSRDFITGWSGSDATATPGRPDPTGGAQASDLSASVAGGHMYRSVNALSGDGTKALGVIARKSNAAQFAFGLFDLTALVWRHRVQATWGASTPSTATVDGAGTRFEPVHLFDDWWWFSATATSCVAANDHRVYLYPGGTSAAFTTQFYDCQVEDGAFPTLPIHTPTGASVARAAESLYWKNPPAPQAMVWFSQFQVGSPSGGSSWYALSMGQEVATEELFLLYRGGAAWTAYAKTAGETVSYASLADLGEGVGDWMQFAVIFDPGGTMRIHGRIVDGPTSSGSAAHAALVETRWDTPRFMFNGGYSGAYPAYPSAVKGERIMVVDPTAPNASLANGEALLDELAAVITDTNGNPI